MIASLVVSNTRPFNTLIFSHDEPTGRCFLTTGRYSRAVTVEYVRIISDIVTDLFSILTLLSVSIVG